MSVEIVQDTKILKVTSAGDVWRKDALHFLGVTVATLANYERSGRLRRTKRFGNVFYLAADVKRLGVSYDRADIENPARLAAGRWVFGNHINCTCRGNNDTVR